MGDSLSELTTLRLGGPAANIVPVLDAAEIVAAVREAQEERIPVLLIAGGSNLVISDAGFDGTVIHLQGRGAEIEGGTVTAQAGEPWDALVDRCVASGLAGVEALSGIPGSVGATPIQNVGAYGQEVADSVVSVRVFDRSNDRVEEVDAAGCQFGYRSSRFKYQSRFIVLSVTFSLSRSALSMPVVYAELARALGVSVGDRAPLGDVRDAVLALRRGKGMVIDPADPDSVSAGSFFTNPILDAQAFAELARRAQAEPPRFPEAHRAVKTSAAWLIERAGSHKGDIRGNVGISAKHSLALVNRGGATTAELVAFAREIAAAVRARFGVDLHPEPIFVGHTWLSA